MNPPAKLSDLIEALEFDSPMHITYFDRQTGRVVTVDSDVMSGVEEGGEERLQGLPDWQKEEVEIAMAVCDDNGERFIDAPNKFDFHEYRHVERFIETVENEKAAEELWRAIRGRGAFRYFKDTAERLGLLERWFRYRDEAMKEFVIAWAEANNVPLRGRLSGTDTMSALFALTDRIEVRWLRAQAQEDRLMPSLLAQAFRGELVYDSEAQCGQPIPYIR